MAGPPVFNIEPVQFRSDPYPVLATLRSECPIAYVPQLDSILFTRRNDIATAEKDIAVFSSHQPDGLMNQLRGQNMMRKDGEEHQLEKKALFPAISPATVRDHWTAVFQFYADKLLDELEPAGEADLVQDFALPYSADCLRSLTGLTNITAQQMDSASQHMINGIANYAGDSETEARCKQATALLDRAINEIAEKNDHSAEPSLLSVMLQSGMPIGNVRSNIKLAISGGQNEPRDAIAGAVWALLSHPQQYKLVSKGEVGYVKVFEEYARWISPIGMSPRRIAMQHRFKDIELQVDDRIFFMFGSANRDEQCFEFPAQFNLKNDTSKSIAFGAGPHFCAGAWASRAMIADVALPSVFKRLKRLRINHKKPAPVMDGWAFRGLLNLPVEWDL